MPAPVIAAIIAGSAGLGAAALSSKGSQSAANTSSAAAQHAADLQAKAAADALAYQKTQAAQDQSNFNTTQQANYNQWASGQNRMRGLDSLVGLPQRDIPAYQQPQNVLGSSQTTPTSGTMPTGGSGNPQDHAFIQCQLANVYKTMGLAPTGPGTGPTDIAYMAQKVAETGGWTPQNASYWPQRIADEVAKAKGGGAVSGAPSASGGAAPASLANYVGASQMAAPVTPGLVMPRTAYQPRSIAQLFGS